MKWNHLPNNGGIYAQRAGLMDKFYYIFAERSAFQEAERRKEERKQGPRSRPKNSGRR